MAFEPIPCVACGGGGGGVGPPTFDSEQHLLCDVGPDGEILGTAMMVTVYPEDGSAPAAPQPVNPVDGTPYVAQGILQPCPGNVGCQPPLQFCFTTTASGPVEHPGRIYDLTLPINPGFAVDSLQIDATSYPANLTWAVTDADGEQFRAALQSFLAARFPEQTVTVTNPNVGTPVCGLAQAMTIHIECARIDDGAPELVELIYNGGRDLVVNPAYLTTPPTNLNGPQFVYLRRQDAGGTLNCTNVANTGWETNDLGDGNRDFELWGQGPGGLQTIQNTTPTPRGTPVQEITADINDSGTGPTIWQTFVVPAAGTVRVVMVHGARDNGETHRITLSTGDTNDNQVGDIINNVTNPPQVTNAGGNSPGPWTTFQQDVALGAGTYTFAISTTNPVGPNRGGLFTDMRVIVDSPDQHAAAVTDDETCTVTTQETVTTTTCEYWAPRCTNGEIIAWRNVADGEELLNAAFWGQVPAPQCCLPSGAGGSGGTVTPGNLIHNYDVCANLNGVNTTLQRVVLTDQSGGVVGGFFVGPNGGPVAPGTYSIGPCGADGCAPVKVGEGCYINDQDLVLKYTSYRNCDGQTVYYSEVGADITAYILANGTATCVDVTYMHELLCDADGASFIRIWQTTANGNIDSLNDKFQDYDLAGESFIPTNPVGPCAESSQVLGTRCYSIPTDGQTFTGTTGSADFVEAPDNTFTATNYLGSGVDVTIAAGGPASMINGTHIQFNPAGAVPVTIVFSEPVKLNHITVGELDAAGVETINLFNPPFTGLTGFLVEIPAASGIVRSTADNADPDGNILFGGVQTNSLTYNVNDNGLGQWLQGLSFTTLEPGDIARAAVVRCEGCDTAAELVYIDLATGAVLDPEATVWAICPEDVPAEPVTTGRDVEQEVLCDNNGPFLRVYQYGGDTGTPSGAPSDFTLAGAPYVVTGPVAICGPTTAYDSRDAEILVLCDSTAPTPVRFLRKYLYDGETGAATAFVNTTLDGTTPYAPVGAVQVCSVAVQTDFDFLATVLCDSNGTQFIQRLTFNSSTGAVTSTTNTTLTGAAFVPVGAVALCTNCCPIEIGHGCLTGGRFYTALRLPNGTVSLINSVTGAVVLAADIIPCVSDDTVVTQSSEARLLAATQAWTPGADLVGTLTGLTFQVLTGTASLVDTSGTAVAGIPAGTSVSWNVEDNNTLQAPQSITADAASTVLVSWTRR